VGKFSFLGLPEDLYHYGRFHSAGGMKTFAFVDHNLFAGGEVFKGYSKYAFFFR
jgi:hypothetical protein